MQFVILDLPLAVSHFQTPVISRKSENIIMNSQAFSTAVATIAVLGLLTCSGCGPSRPETAPVAGRVTFQGKPVAEGMITFLPEHGRPAIGAIGPDGGYRLTTFEAGDGAPPGKYTVTIEARRVTAPPAPKSMKDEVNVPLGQTKVEWLVPERYARPDATPLTAEVVRGANTIDFNLP